MDNSAILEVSGLTKIYQGRQQIRALDNIDLTVRRGELFGLLGPNGAGKTTTIGVCTTRTLPTSGRVQVAGLDVVQHPAVVRRAIGVVSQFNTLDRSCTVYENLYFHCRYFGFSHGQAKKRAQELLEQFRLSERAKSFVRELSGGLARRVELARAVAHYPEALFLDEPSAGLDPQTRHALWDLIRALRSQGTTIVLTTHYMEEADVLCERLAIIDHGKLLVCDSPSKLKQELGAHTVYDLHLAGPAQEIPPRLRQLPGVSKVEAIPGGARLLASERVGLLPLIVEATDGYALRDISIKEPSLETVFLSLTGRELRE